VWDDHGVDLKFCEGRGGEAAVLVSLHKKLTCQIGDKYRTLRLVPAFGGYGCATMGFEECTAVFSRDDVPFRV
jgi:hypothetical protein